MQRQFTETINGMRGLINSWSASSSMIPAPDVIPGEDDESPLLLAISGGIDSMCMADLFLHADPSVPFAVAHCNFRLRGEESDGDEALVRRWAEENGIRFFSASFDTEAYAAEHGISVEMAARDLRYGWFARLCSENSFAGVAVAHNANDNAETLMLNLLRGSGIKGLSGMSAVSRMSVCGDVAISTGITVLRPLLTFTRKQIEGYVFAHKVAYREDRTNALSDYKRNRIRNEAFPIFEKINPSFIRTLNRDMTYFSEASEIVDDWCRAASASVLQPSRPGDDDVKISCRIGLPHLLGQSRWRYLLYHLLEPYGFNSAVLASIENLLASGRTVSGKLFESDTHVLMTGRTELTVVLKEPDASGSKNGETLMPVRCAGTYHVNGRTINVEVLDWSYGMPLKQPEGVLIFDASRLAFPFILRAWRSGDWLVPLGMKGRKKVSDLFTDLKFDPLQKNAAVMVVDTCTEGLAACHHIAAVAGVRIDDRYKVRPETSSVIRISVF